MLTFAPNSSASVGFTMNFTPHSGETVRSSTDAAPSPQTPVIIAVTESADGMPQCDARPPGYPDSNPCHGPARIEVIGQLDPEPAFRFNPAWPVDGFQVNITPDERSQGFSSLTIDVDRSLIEPGWLGQGSSPFAAPLEAGFRCSSFTDAGYQSGEKTIEQLADGDLRITTTYLHWGCTPTEQIGVVSVPFGSLAQGKDRDDPTVKIKLKSVVQLGVPLPPVTPYRSKFAATVKVSKADAKKLKLKSTTIGALNFTVKNAEDASNAAQWVVLTKQATKALKGVKKLAFVLIATATGAPGQTWSMTQTYVAN